MPEEAWCPAAPLGVYASRSATIQQLLPKFENTVRNVLSCTSNSQLPRQFLVRLSAAFASPPLRRAQQIVRHPDPSANSAHPIYDHSEDEVNHARFHLACDRTSSLLRLDRRFRRVPRRRLLDPYAAPPGRPFPHPPASHLQTPHPINSRPFVRKIQPWNRTTQDK
jgi:hypothetical protein